MVHLYGFSRYELDSTQSAPIFLSLEQHQPLFRVGFPSHLLLLALCPVFLERWVIGRISSYNFGEAGDWGFIGLDQFGLSWFMECPVAIAFEVACPHPSTAFLRVSAFRPVPKHQPLGMSNLFEGFAGCTVAVVICPSPYNWVELLDYFHCRGLLMCIQIGAYCPDMFQDFFLLWDGQQCTPLSESPDVKPQEVKPFRAVHNPGFGFAEFQPSFLEKCLNSRSGMGFQYFSGWGRCHKVIGVANDRYPFIDASAFGRWSWSSIGVFCVEQPFHPVQCHVCQQRGALSPYKVANFFFRDRYHLDMGRSETRY